MSEHLHQGGRAPLILPRSPIRADLRSILRAALRAADPALAIRRAVTLTNHRLRAAGNVYDLRRVRRVVAVGAGKAAISMARALAGVLGKRLDCALVVAPRGARGGADARLRVAYAGHPVPDGQGLKAAGRIIDLVAALEAEDLLIVLLSGGASSLLPFPEKPLTLSDEQRTTTLLLRSGATIAEVNAVRKHLSAIKGGRLAAATRAQVLTLVLSDVRGDDLGVIGSGPTAPDPTTFLDAVRIVRRYGIWNKLPARARRHLLDGLGGARADTPKPRSAVFRRVRHAIVGNNRLACEAAADAARRAGYEAVLIDEYVTGEADRAGRWMAELGANLAGRTSLSRPVCVIAGGEVTVTVRGNGRGGRAQEFALAAAVAMPSIHGVWVIGFGTDGRDGPTDAAGAVADGSTVARGKLRRLDATDALRRNDSYRFFAKAGGHIKTGLTGTNVNDLYLVLVRP